MQYRHLVRSFFNFCLRDCWKLRWCFIEITSVSFKCFFFAAFRNAIPLLWNLWWHTGSQIPWLAGFLRGPKYISSIAVWRYSRQKRWFRLVPTILLVQKKWNYASGSEISTISQPFYPDGLKRQIALTKLTGSTSIHSTLSNVTRL